MPDELRLCCDCVHQEEYAPGFFRCLASVDPVTGEMGTHDCVWQRQSGKAFCGLEGELFEKKPEDSLEPTEGGG